MSKGDLRLGLFLLLLGLAFCGDPDLHDAAIERLRGEMATPENQR